jgi:hypothetical protein
MRNMGMGGWRWGGEDGEEVGAGRGWVGVGDGRASEGGDGWAVFGL